VALAQLDEQGGVRVYEVKVVRRRADDLARALADVLERPALRVEPAADVPVYLVVVRLEVPPVVDVLQHLLQA
jgi:hypothetical protein